MRNCVVKDRARLGHVRLQAAVVAAEGRFPAEIVVETVASAVALELHRIDAGRGLPAMMVIRGEQQLFDEKVLGRHRVAGDDPGIGLRQEVSGAAPELVQAERPGDES